MLGGGHDATNKRWLKAAEPALRTTLLQLGARAIAGDLERDGVSPLLDATSGWMAERGAAIRANLTQLRDNVAAVRLKPAAK